MSFLDVKDLTVSYGQGTTVGPVSFTAEQGEFISLLGPSGCGKTTSLRCIAGFAEPTSGSITVEGRRLLNLPPHKREIGLVFQNYALFPHLTVFENVAFGLRLRKRPQDEITRRVNRALERVGLSGFDQRFPLQLSGGQQQRVALARSLVLEPKLLLLDEPLSNLDAKLRVQMRALLKDLQREIGITTVYVTHDQTEALALSDRIVVMNKGLVCQVASPRDIYEKPATPFVADFIGESNLLDAKIVDKTDQGCRVEAAGLAMISTERVQSTANAQVTVLVRPEYLRVYACREDALPDDNVFAAVVTSLTYLGDGVQMGLQDASGQAFTANLPSRQSDLPHLGASVIAAVAPHDVHLILGHER